MERNEDFYKMYLSASNGWGRLNYVSREIPLPVNSDGEAIACAKKEAEQESKRFEKRSRMVQISVYREKESFKLLGMAFRRWGKISSFIVMGSPPLRVVYNSYGSAIPIYEENDDTGCCK